MKGKFFILLLTLFLLSCGRSDKNAAEANPGQREAVAVMVDTVRETVLSERIKITAEVAPLWQVDIFPRSSGKVIAKWARLGEQVSKGQRLAEFIQDLPGLDYSPVKIEADVAGVLTQDLIEIGSTVTPQKPVFTISELRRVYVIARVFETLAAEIRVGDMVMIDSDVLEKPITGRVAEINPSVQRPARTVEVKIIVDNAANRLKPGMFAICYFQTPARKGLSIPLEAVIRSGANKYVYVVNQDRVRLQTIQTGIIQDKRIEVTSGLQAGERVVIVGQNQLQDGRQVRVMEETGK